MATSCGGNFTPNLNLKLLEKSLRWRRQLLQPAFPSKEADFAVALLDWESDVSRYEAEFAKTIDEEDKRAVL